MVRQKLPKFFKSTAKYLLYEYLIILVFISLCKVNRLYETVKQNKDYQHDIYAHKSSKIVCFSQICDKKANYFIFASL